MKHLFALALALLCGLTQAQTVTSSVRWELRIKGSTEALGTYTTQTLCDAAARARGLTAVYECPRLLAVTGAAPVVCQPAPAASTSTSSRACGTGETGGPVVSTVTTTYTRGPAPACTLTSATSTATAGVCTPVAPPPTGAAVYVSDCQAGAVAGCVAGNDAWPGTQAQPKRTIAAANPNALAAGASVLLNRAGSWVLGGRLDLNNRNVTLAAPLVVDGYGTGPGALLTFPQCSNGINIGGGWGNTDNDGGYTLRGVRLATAAPCTAQGDQFGVWLVQNVRGVLLDGVDITGFKIGVNSSEGSIGVTGVTVRNSRIHRNSSMGMLGPLRDSVIEGNTFEANNFSGSTGNHAQYGSHYRNVTVRGNRYINNSVDRNGQCTGGNFTVHGQVDGLLIEGNTITVPAGAAFGCYGFAITSGYSSVEAFRNVIVRGNTVTGIGYAAIAANAAPGIVVEGNRLNSGGGVVIPANGGPDADDARDADAIVRNNTLCGGGTVQANVPGAQVSGNSSAGCAP